VIPWGRHRVKAQEATQAMGRVSPLIVAVISLASACGCGGLGWYRAVGHLPGVAASDYAFYDFCDVSSQLFQFSPPQVESSLIEGLRDLGFKVLGPPDHRPDGESWIYVKTPDGRPANITVTPQNAMTNVRVRIGPVHIGDSELSHELLRRVALNFGTAPRAYTPVETTLPRRHNVMRGVPIQIIQHEPPEVLEGEGLRPIETRDRPAAEAPVPGSEEAPPTNLPGPFQPFIPTRDFPNPPYMPYSPFPYTPFNSDMVPN
jgi:hypothetical protein